MPIDRATIESEITMWSDLYEWHSDDMSKPMERSLLTDAIALAEKHGGTDPQAVYMALIIEQAKLISRWGKEILKVRTPNPIFDREP